MIEVRITLLDGARKPIMSWRIEGAFPCKITGPELKAQGNELAIETLELAHEGFVPE